MLPFCGNPVTALLRPTTGPVKNDLDPAVGPTSSQYPSAPVPAVQLKVADPPDRVEPGLGATSTATSGRPVGAAAVGTRCVTGPDVSGGVAGAGGAIGDAAAGDLDTGDIALGDVATGDVTSVLTTTVTNPAKEPFLAVTACACADVPPIVGTVTVTGSSVPTFPVATVGPQVANPEKSLGSNVIRTTS